MMGVFVILTILLFYKVNINTSNEQSDDGDNDQIGLGVAIIPDEETNNTKLISPNLIDISPSSTHYLLVGSSLNVTCKVLDSCKNCYQITLTVDDKPFTNVITNNSG